MKFKDQMHNVFELQNTPKRIICLVPSLTELLVDLGLKDSIVGVTKFCVHPNGLKKTKTIVGGTKTIKVDKIEALQPDIILCNKEENTPEIVATCNKIAPVHVSDIYTIKDVFELITQYGNIFSCEKKADEISNQLQKSLANFKTFIADKNPIKSVYFIWKNPWMVAANQTFINHILELNKFDNLFKNKDRYPEIKLKEIDKDATLFLLSSEPYPFKNKDIEELKASFKTSTICLVNGEYFSWYGTRLLKAFDYFKTFREEIDYMLNSLSK